MKKRLQEILHQYKVDSYRLGHSPDSLQDITKECLHFSDDALKNAYHYHFHKLPDANRVEIINMINNYTVEAILPPVVEKIMQRIVILERQHKALLGAIEQVCEELSDGEAGKA